MTITITSRQEELIRTYETERYIGQLRLRYCETEDCTERSRISEMIGAAESVLAIWTTPMEHFWDE